MVMFHSTMLVYQRYKWYFLADVLGLYGIIWPDVFDPRRSASFLFDRGELWVHGKAMPLPSNAFDLVIDKSLMDTFACAEERKRENKTIVIGDKQGVILPGVLHIVGIPISTYQTTSISISGLDRCNLNSSHILVARGFDFFDFDHVIHSSRSPWKGLCRSLTWPFAAGNALDHHHIFDGGRGGMSEKHCELVFAPANQDWRRPKPRFFVAYPLSRVREQCGYTS